MSKVIISAAVTGGGTTRAQNPNLPLSPQEIADATVACWRAGASIVHIHARDDNGRATHDVDRFRTIVELVRATECDVILNLSTGSKQLEAPIDARLECVQLRPELASFDCGSMNFGERVFLNPPDFLERMAKTMLEHGVKPEIECFDSGMVYNAFRLMDRGLLQPPYLFQFVLGVAGGAPATPKTLLHLVELLPKEATFSVCALGRGQLPLNVMAMLLGGHARTGLEDNVYYRRGELARSNEQLVERVARLARELTLEPTTANEARAMLGIKPRAETGAA